MLDKTLGRLEFDKLRRQLAEHTSFSAGRRLALELRPSFDAEEVCARQALTAQARAYGDRHGAPPMGGVHDLRDEIEGAVRGRTLLPQELLDLSDTLGAAVRLRKALASGAARAHWPDLAAMAEGLEPGAALCDAIGGALDPEGNVRDGASAELRRVRRELRVAHDRLMRQLETIVGGSQYRDVLQDALITQREGRFVVPVKSEFRARLPGIVHDTSDSGATVFVEPLQAVEAGNRLRELARDEEREVERILRQLSALVGEAAEGLVETTEVLARLDLVFAAAELGHAQRAVAPQIVPAGRPFLAFPAARHPLLDPARVVAIDMRVGDDFRQLVITGPNTGGKTVALKTTGLLVLMAQAGLHIPAGDGAKMAVFDGVYADIGDEQSIEQSLSTFSSHLTNIVGILTAATPRSLVLLDELGAGTDPVEGAALAEALLEHLQRRDVACVASTHYSSLKLYAHGTAGVANASVEFDVETLRPTFELTIGLPGRSNALAIAGRLGLSASIVEDARARMTESDVQMEDLLAEIRDARRHAAADRAAAAEARQRADEWAAKLEQGVRALQLERGEILDHARREADAEIAAAREAVARLLRDARRDEATAAAVAEVARKLDKVAAAVREVRPPPPPPPSDELAVGARVYVASARKEGELLRTRGDLAEVQVGRLRLTVAQSDLTVVAPPPEPPAESAGPLPRLHRTTPEAGVTMELDLRGLRVDEGLERLDGYLDQALLSGLPWVRVIHGHGTGAMKAAVRDTLRKHRSVTRSRAGEQGEGGDGVTVAYFE